MAGFGHSSRKQLFTGSALLGAGVVLTLWLQEKFNLIKLFNQTNFKI